MADIFQALSDIRKAGSADTAVADPVDDVPDNPQSGDIFSTLNNIRASVKPAKGLPPDQINPPIPPTSFAREMVKNTPGALAQGAADLGRNVISAGKTAITAAKSAGGDIMDALDSIRQPGAASAAIAAIPDTVSQIGKDVGGVVTKAGAGLLKGVTMGAVDPEKGTVGIPFTSIQKQVAPKLSDTLAQLGVSPEIAKNPAIGAAPEFVAAAGPWGKISKAVGFLGKTIKGAVAGSEVAAPLAQTAEEAVTKLLGGSIKDKLAQTAGRITQEGVTGAIYGLGKVRGPDEDPMVNALSAATWGAGGSLALEVVGGVAGYMKAKQLVGLKDDIAKYLYDTKAVGSEEAANHQASRIVINKLYQKGGIDNVSHSEFQDARQTVDKALEDFKAKNPVAPVEPSVETTAEVAPSEATAATPETPPVQPEAAAPAQGPDVYPEVTNLERDTTPSVETPKAPSTNIVDALAEVRQEQTPPTLSDAQTPEAPPEQKADLAKPTDLPVIQEQAKEGEPYAVYNYHWKLSADEPGLPYFKLFGDKAKIEAMTKVPGNPTGNTWKSDVPLDVIQKSGIPIRGKMPEAKDMPNEDVLNAYAAQQSAKATETMPPVDVAPPNKGKAPVDLNKSQRLSLEVVRGEISQGSPGYRMDTNAGENDPIEGTKIIGVPSTYPDYFQNQGYTAKEALSAIDKALKGEPLTEKQRGMVQSLNQDFRHERVRDIMTARGQKTFTAWDLQPGDRFMSNGEQMHVKSVDDSEFVPKAVLEGPNGEHTLNGDETIKYDHGTVERIRMPETPAKAKLQEADLPNMPGRAFPETGLKKGKGGDESLSEMQPQDEKQTSFGGGGYALAPMPTAEPTPGKKPDQPDLVPPPPSDVPPPEATHEAPIFELPEMVHLAKELMDGKFPQVVKRIRAAGGRALGVFYPGKGTIQIRADQFKNPEEAAHTLSHEIGHLVDWLPEKDIKRGNIIGRIASLQKYMKNEFLGETFEKHLFKNNVFRAELKALTKKWHPFNEDKAPKSYLSYRYSAPELYAEAWSVLLNNPKMLKDTAPQFYNALFEYLDRKPRVKELYDDLHEVIRQGKTAETRHERETAAYAKADLQAKLKNEAKGHPLRTIWDEMREALVDSNSKIISSVARARKAGEHIPAEENPMHALEELRYSSAEQSEYAQTQGRIYHDLKDAGIEWNDMGAYLKADRVINERSEMANPGGQTAKAAGEEIAHLRQKYGDKFGKIESAAQEMRGPNRDYLIRELEKADMLSPELMEKIRTNEHYAPFDIIIDDAEKSLGGASSNVGPQIYSQMGTLRDIKNPATALVMKDLALLRNIRVQQAKLKQADWMLSHEKDWIAPAETRWNGTAHVPVEPADRENTGLMAFYQKGKIRAYYVPRTIADSFRYDPQEASLMVDAWERFNSFFKQIFTAANPGFQVMNVPRDMGSLVMNLRGMSYSKALRYYVKVGGSAKRFAAGEHDPLIQEMLRRKVLITPQNRWSTVAHEVEMESIINHFSDKENEYNHWYSKVFGPMLDRVKMVGQISEGISKIAGFQYLKDHQAEFGLNDKDLDHLVRFQAGSPPFLVSGKQSRAISRFLLFFNPHVQGFRRSFEAARLNPGEYSAKLMKYNFLPTLLKYLAWAGVFGEGIRRTYRRVSSYNHANYHVIAWDGPNNKTIALKLPMDDTERFYNGILWYTLTSQPVAKVMAMLGYTLPKERYGEDFTKVFSYTAGQAPNLTPGLGALTDLVQYASGHIPYDSFRGKPGIPQNIFDAGGMRSHTAFLKYELNQLGAGLVYRFNTGDIQKVRSDLEKILGAPVIGNVLSRFISSTDYGTSELIQNRVEMAKQEEARQRLDYRDAIVQSIMAHDKPADAGEVAKLYADLMKQGTLLNDPLNIKTFTSFYAYYKRLQSQRQDDPYVNALLFAKSDGEKGAVLDVAQENLTKAEYDKLIAYSLTQGFTKARTLVEGMLKQKLQKE